MSAVISLPKQNEHTTFAHPPTTQLFMNKVPISCATNVPCICGEVFIKDKNRHFILLVRYTSGLGEQPLCNYHLPVCYSHNVTVSAMVIVILLLLLRLLLLILIIIRIIITIKILCL
jgi:hypothetical protein